MSKNTNITTDNDFTQDCKTALDEVIKIQKTHTENGNILKKVVNKINGYVATGGVILDAYDTECTAAEKKKILAKFVSDVKDLKY